MPQLSHVVVFLGGCVFLTQCVSGGSGIGRCGSIVFKKTMCRDAMLASPTDFYKNIHIGQLERTTRRQLAPLKFFLTVLTGQVAGTPKNKKITAQL
jgi:hypothetical protein